MKFDVAKTSRRSTRSPIELRAHDLDKVRHAHLRAPARPSHIQAVRVVCARGVPRAARGASVDRRRPRQFSATKRRYSSAEPGRAKPNAHLVVPRTPLARPGDVPSGRKGRCIGKLSLAAGGHARRQAGLTADSIATVHRDLVAVTTTAPDELRKAVAQAFVHDLRVERKDLILSTFRVLSGLDQAVCTVTSVGGPDLSVYAHPCLVFLGQPSSSAVRFTVTAARRDGLQPGANRASERDKRGTPSDQLFCNQVSRISRQRGLPTVDACSHAPLPTVALLELASSAARARVIPADLGHARPTETVGQLSDRDPCAPRRQ